MFKIGSLGLFEFERVKKLYGAITLGNCLLILERERESKKGFEKVNIYYIIYPIIIVMFGRKIKSQKLLTDEN